LRRSATRRRAAKRSRSCIQALKDRIELNYARGEEWSKRGENGKRLWFFGGRVACYGRVRYL
jgi:hypothetical protein